MNEPLNMSAPTTNFTGKTLNLHPHYFNQPLRLIADQTQNPNLVFDDFFECYHLNEVREIMWQWLTDAVSSPRSHSNDPHERNNYMFFYEKMESLVEAAWIMNWGSGTVNNKASQVNDNEDNKPVQTTAKAAQPDRYSKPGRLIEKAASHPDEVIAEVFSHIQFDELQQYLLPSWLRVALINTASPYAASIDREILYEFYEQLLPFVEALYLIADASPEIHSTCLTVDQQSNPSGVINAFFQQFSMDYIRRELADFLEAGIGYEGSYPNGFSPWQAWMSYNHLLCLTEAAYQRYINQQMQSVTSVFSQQMVELEEVDNTFSHPSSVFMAD